eukprot:GDKK01047813.1.p1 GENE.GDKK01047813.1~~GDKK01047813.1.p1  ORF type:complete len:412 (+),score=97.77 GDKK01047813.1:1-1236(+)
MGSMQRVVNPVAEQWSRVHVIEKLAKKSIQSLTIQSLLKNSSSDQKAIIRNADWIREEMKVRFAHRIWDFHRLPYVINMNPQIKQVYDLYFKTFNEFNACPVIKTPEQEEDFAKVIDVAIKDHGIVIDLMREGVRDIRQACPDLANNTILDPFLERLFSTRISRRVILEHHLALRALANGELPNSEKHAREYAGVVQLQCKPAEMVKKVAQQVGQICAQQYGFAPHVKVSGNLETSFAFVPEHLHIILYEMLKNSMRATVEFHTLGNSIGSMPVSSADLPPIHVGIFRGKRDIIIKISDKGGGILPQRLDKIWSYGYSSVADDKEKAAQRSNLNSPMMDMHSLGNVGDAHRNELAGYGFGLPLSRAYARYFGGDIHLQPLFGHGTDAYINLNMVGDQKEALADSPQEYALD